MKRIKIVQKYFTESEARKAATYQRQHAKKNNVLVSKVEVLPAYNLFRANGWFKCNPVKNIGLPAPEQYMVIVHYSIESATSKQATNLRKRIIEVVRKKEVRKRFFIVILNVYQLKNMPIIPVMRLPTIISWRISKEVRITNWSHNARFVAA